MKKWFFLLFKYNSGLSFQAILVMIELVIALSVFNISYGMSEMGQIRKQYINAISDKNLVTYERNDSIASEYCESNGIILGSVRTLYIDYNEKFSYVIGNSIDIYEKEFLDELSMSLSKGNLSKTFNSNSYDFAVIIPPALEKQYQFGQTYTLSITNFNFYPEGGSSRFDKEVKVYIWGVLEQNIVFRGTGFGENFHQMIGIDVNGILEGLNPETTTNYCKLSSAISGDDLQNNHISDFKSEGSLAIDEINKNIAFPLIMCCLLIIIFIAGFIGMHFLKISKKEKQYAIFSVIGISKKKAIGLQIVKDLCYLILPFLLSIIVLWAINLYYPIHISTIGVLFSFAFVSTIYLLVSILTLIRLIRYNPITAIRKNIT